MGPLGRNRGQGMGCGFDQNIICMIKLSNNSKHTQTIKIPYSCIYKQLLLNSVGYKLIIITIIDMKITRGYVRKKSSRGCRIKDENGVNVIKIIMYMYEIIKKIKIVFWVFKKKF